MAYTALSTSYTPEPYRCSGEATTGAIILQAWACDESPWRRDLWDVGIYNCRYIGGTNTLSQHASGRAGDSAHNIINGHSHPSGKVFANWLVQNHAILGIQEVISDYRRWDNQQQRWESYGGQSPHTDHVHWSLNTAGATYLTRARILSVAPRRDPLAMLTDAEAEELLANSRSAKTNAAIAAKRAPRLVKRGSSGVKVFLQVGGILKEVGSSADDPAVDILRYDMGQSEIVALPAAAFDKLHRL
jgi:hypothetical protein